MDNMKRETTVTALCKFHQINVSYQLRGHFIFIFWRKKALQACRSLRSLSMSADDAKVPF